MRIRPSTPEDLAAVDAILSRSYPSLLKADYPPSVMVTALPHISRAQPNLLSCGTYYVAEQEDGTLIGAGGWTPDRKDDRLGHVRHVGTDINHLRRGVAKTLIDHSLDMAANAGIEVMEAWSTRTAVRFYEALGFKQIGPIEVPLAPGITFPSIRMRRNVK